MSVQRTYVGTTPTISDTILNSQDRTINLTGATVTFVYRPEDLSSPEVSVSAVVDPDQVNNEGQVSATLGSPIMDAPADWVWWWHVVFSNATILDTGNNVLLVETHGPGSGATPYITAPLFRRLTRVKQTRLGIADGQQFADEFLQTEIDRAAAYIEFVTGQPATSADLAPLPTYIANGGISAGAMTSMLSQAIQMRTEQVTFQAQNAYVDDASDDVVTSFSVGGYSQSKSDPTRRGEEKSLNSWDALTKLLWLLMTPDRYAFWIVFLSSDPTLALGAGYGFENTFQPEIFDGWGYGFGYADAYLAGNILGTGWAGGLGGTPGGIWPLMVD